MIEIKRTGPFLATLWREGRYSGTLNWLSDAKPGFPPTHTLNTCIELDPEEQDVVETFLRVEAPRPFTPPPARTYPDRIDPLFNYGTND